MLFNSYAYLIYFLPIAALGFFGFGERARWAVRWLVAASLIFYGWWNPDHLPLIAASIVGNFWIARRIQHAANPRRWLIAGVAGNLALLGIFKYADFLLRTLAQVGSTPLVQFDLALPLGISFFTFTQIAFLVDVSRRKASEPSFDNYALFVTFFPHLLAGPIIHHSEMMPQFASTTNKRVAWENVGAGHVPARHRAREESVPRGPAGAAGRGRLRPCRDGRHAAGLAFRTRLHAADLFRFQRLHRHGARRCADLQHPPADQFRLALPRRSTCASSGIAGTSRCRVSCANTSTFPWAATAPRNRACSPTCC